MCPPAAAIPALMLAGTAVTAAGALYGGLAVNAQARTAAKVAGMNERAEADRVRDTLERGALEHRQLDRQYGQIGGQQRAAMAANGTDLSYGSADLTQQDTSMLHMEDKQALTRNTYLEVRGLDMGMANYRAQRSAAKAQGRSALIGSIFSTGGSLLSGASQYGEWRAKYGTSGGAGAYGIAGSSGIY
jgi:hypothetical protein